MSVSHSFIVLFCIATALAVVVRHLRVPYTVALVVAGLALGAMGIVHPPRLTGELLFSVFLPGLLFEAAFHLDMSDLRKDVVPITALAIPGVVLSIALTGVLVAVALRTFGVDPQFSMVSGLVFGCVVAATDPVAVVALFRQLRITRRLLVLLEGESLLNDGTAIVFFGLAVAYVTGTTTTPGGLVLEFVRTAGGGALLGAVVGAIAARIIRRMDDAMIEITLTVIAAYGSFALAEELRVSGVIATVVAGFLCGNDARRAGMSESVRATVESFWEYVAFALNSIVFLLLGFEVSPLSLLGAWREILVAYVAMLLARAAIIGGVMLLRRSSAHPIPQPWSAALLWGGLRGALSLVLAFALPESFANRQLFVTMTAGVVLLTLVFQGLTMLPLLRRLKLTQE